MLHDSGIVIAQTEVESKTNEIKALRPLFADRESLAGTVVTADAMHAQRDHAKFIVEELGVDYLVGVKSNQPRRYPKGCYLTRIKRSKLYVSGRNWTG